MRVFITEDDDLLRQNLRFLLGGERDIDVVGAAASAEETLDRLPAARPEVLLCDLGLPKMSGVELIARVHGDHPDLDIMAYTVFEDRDTVFSAIKAGATGYILKGAPPREVIEALTNLRNGGAPMSPKIARSLIREFQEAPVEADYLLTAREKQVLQHIEHGLSYKEVGAALSMSAHTVHSHIKKTYEKLQAKGKRDALIKARRRGLI